MWYPDKLEKQVKVMEKKSEIGFCYSGFRFLSENSKKLKSAYNNKKLKSGYICSNLISNYNANVEIYFADKK